MNVILPVAGKSSRFPNVRPKWLLTNPNGNFMIVDSILGMELETITSLNLIYLKEHEDKFNFKKGLLENLKKYLSLQKTQLRFCIEINSLNEC